MKLFWELEGLDALSTTGSSLGKVEGPWLESIFERVGEVISEAVKAGVECGSFGLQLMPNAFEVSKSEKYLYCLQLTLLLLLAIRCSALTFCSQRPIPLNHLPSRYSSSTPLQTLVNRAIDSNLVSPRCSRVSYGWLLCPSLDARQ